MRIQQLADYMEDSPELYKILKHCPYEILRLWKLVKYSKGMLIFQQDEVYDRIGIIVEGLANIYVIGENGRKYSQATYSVGEMVGEIEIYDRIPFLSNVEAITDVVMLSLHRDEFLHWIQLDRNFNQYFIRRILYYNYIISKREGINNLYPLQQRVCHYLLQCVRNGIPYPEGIAIEVNKQEWSQRFAVTQRSINRILSKLREEGIIDIRKHQLFVLDMDRLQQQAQLELLE